MTTTDLTTVAALYAAQSDNPDYDPPRYVDSAYAHAGSYYRHRAAELMQGLTVVLTDNPEPYATAYDQATDVARGNFKVSTAHCDHTHWDTMTNVSYRIVHDLIGHAPTSTTQGVPRNVPAFTVAGEIQAWYNQLEYLQANDASNTIIAVSFSETVGQLAYAATRGDFPTHQRGILLPTNPFAPIHDDRP